MDAKEYLEQAHSMDLQIKSKIAQLKSIQSLSQKVTQVLTDMPKAQTLSSSLEDAVCKSVDIEREIKEAVSCLGVIRHDIEDKVALVKPTEVRSVLELRYLAFMDWDEVAASMNYTRRWVLKLHSRGLEQVDELLKRGGT
ncbi:hypothetical protein [Anaerovibrio sp.]|uniref:hypothetical protein n=1 Tax=Anaerovibrio sp. TaxID=1872532 RepID=UPI002626C273|nr:hypothetical protein [Anaerovibrio sp.]MDD6597138.1 hypothetical protein [Anaerovibrio sp.]